ncbi:hypothetical protein VTP01DRAFT_5017, partial [Rhizomucor pusillus]|uniref:uncharacterized protein n=1 Tax=Rhizomucor pusillus TaxID=4840 RepID=UPI003744039A
MSDGLKAQKAITSPEAANVHSVSTLERSGLESVERTLTESNEQQRTEAFYNHMQLEPRQPIFSDEIGHLVDHSSPSDDPPTLEHRSTG